MKKLQFVCIIFAFVSIKVYSQNDSNNKFVAGFGPNYKGFNSKIGIEIQKSFLIGLNFDKNYGTREIGTFGRFYILNTKLTPFAQFGLGYGVFTDKNHKFKNEYLIKKGTKLNASLGLLYSVTKKWSIETDINYGRNRDIDYGLYSFRTGINYKF